MILHTVAVGALVTAIGAIGIAPPGGSNDTSSIRASGLSQSVPLADENYSVWEYTMKTGGKVDIRSTVSKPGGALLNVVSINGELHSVNGPGLVPGMKFDGGATTGVWRLYGTISKAGDYGFYIQRADKDLPFGSGKAVVLVKIKVSERDKPQPAPTPKPAPVEDTSHLEPDYGPNGIEGGTPWF